MIKFHGKQSVEIEGFRFEFVQELEPERDETGKIKEFRPQSHYKNKATCKLHDHGKGSFCEFTVCPTCKGRSGVYALFCGEKLLYVGKCIDLYKRFRNGYGHIAPKNCYKGGRSTNCRVNKMILEECGKGKRITCFFHETSKYGAVETTLLETLDTPWNIKKR